MKKLVLLLYSVLILISCKKKTDNVPINPGLQEFPQSWIFTADETPDKYIYLRTNSATMFRKSVLQSYSLLQLAIDEDCEFEVAQSRNEANNKDCFSIRLDKNKKIWCGVGPSSNQQETFMYALNTTSTDPGDNYKFFLHFMPAVNGVTTVAIESVWKPGWYVSVSPPGFQYAQNQVTMQHANSPEQATRWQCR
jgi:hypothetical protein